MALRFDIHMHTQRHSKCSRIDERLLIRRAARAGLDGLVITEHHYQWTESELNGLIEDANQPGLLVLAGFEYTSSCGDILVYGLPAEAVCAFEPGLPPERFVPDMQKYGAVCIAAHPTRAGMGFDERIAQLGLNAMEVQSVNLKPHEQRMAARLAADLKIHAVAASDAHLLEDVGAYSIEVDAVIRNMADLKAALKHGAFRLSGKTA